MWNISTISISWWNSGSTGDKNIFLRFKRERLYFPVGEENQTSTSLWPLQLEGHEMPGDHCDFTHQPERRHAVSSCHLLLHSVCESAGGSDKTKWKLNISRWRRTVINSEFHSIGSNTFSSKLLYKCVIGSPLSIYNWHDRYFKPVGIQSGWVGNEMKVWG